MKVQNQKTLFVVMEILKFGENTTLIIQIPTLKNITNIQIITLLLIFQLIIKEPSILEQLQLLTLDIYNTQRNKQNNTQT